LIMKKILIIIYISSLLWSCQNYSSESKSALDITKEDSIGRYKISYSTDTSYAEFINGLENVQKQIYLDYDSIKDEYVCRVDFDEYFKSFDKLSISKNWKLESHYRHFGDGGRPLLLAFEGGDKYGDSIQVDLSKSFVGEEYKEMYDYSISQKLFAYQDSVNYLDCIQIIDDKMGYFQFVVFALIGDRYCQFWHSNYGEMSIIASKEQIKALTETKDHFYYKFSTKKEKEEVDSNFENLFFPKFRMDIETVLKINPEPKVTLSDGIATVKIVTLSPWGGFVEQTYTVTRTYPHTLEQGKVDTIVEYNCGILF
jgi:hypothetical protein